MENYLKILFRVAGVLCLSLVLSACSDKDKGNNFTQSPDFCSQPGYYNSPQCNPFGQGGFHHGYPNANACSYLDTPQTYWLPVYIPGNNHFSYNSNGYYCVEYWRLSHSFMGYYNYGFQPVYYGGGFGGGFGGGVLQGCLPGQIQHNCNCKHFGGTLGVSVGFCHGF